MKNKNELGATGIDIVSGIIIFIISTAVVISLYYQIYITTTQTKIHQVAIGCITEIFEEIDLINYDEVTETKVKDMIDEKKLSEYFNKEKNDSSVEYSVIDFSTQSGAKQDLVKQVNITVIYKVGDNITTLPMSKIKIRE